MLSQPAEGVDGARAMWVNLKMEVGSRTRSGVTDPSDPLPEVHSITDSPSQRARLHVPVDARDHGPSHDVPDGHSHTITAAPARFGDNALGDRQNGRTIAGGNVDPFVVAGAPPAR